MRANDDMLTFYKKLICPHLEYGTQIWNLVVAHDNYKIIMDIDEEILNPKRVI